MRSLPVLILLTALAAGAVAAQQPAAGVPIADPAPAPPPFDDWFTALLAEARARGYSERVLEDTLSGVEPLERVIQSDRSQAELTPGFERYLSSRLTNATVRRGRDLARQHRTLLRRVSAKYGVPSRFLVAIWGVETRYGRVTGRVPVFQALTTLAWEPRRADFFRRELFDALTIVSNGYVRAAQMKGSWAGAMGQTQFMPSSYLKHAVDFDGDGDRDIWSSTGDALASIASYLKAYGWTSDSTWGREVRVSRAAGERIAAAVPMRQAGCYAIRNMTERVLLSRWRELGVTRADGGPLPTAHLSAGLVTTDTRQFLVYENYDAILGYNCAHYYALTVALLADRLR